MIRKQVEIEAADGKFDAYLSAPETGKGPGVVMVSTIFGVDQSLKSMCDELAERGCVALAQNFFWRDEDSGQLAPADVERAIARVMRIDFAAALGDLRSGIAEVRSHPNYNGRSAVFGFCFGGPLAWRSACDDFGIDASVSFHGTYVSRSMRPGDRPKCPVSFHYGDQDEFAPPEELAAVQETADATGSEFVIHPGAGHGYMGTGNPDHRHAEAARNSWDRALQMLDGLRT